MDFKITTKATHNDSPNQQLTTVALTSHSSFDGCIDWHGVSRRFVFGDMDGQKWAFIAKHRFVDHLLD